MYLRATRNQRRRCFPQGPQFGTFSSLRPNKSATRAKPTQTPSIRRSVHQSVYRNVRYSVHHSLRHCLCQLVSQCTRIYHSISHCQYQMVCHDTRPTTMMHLHLQSVHYRLRKCVRHEQCLYRLRHLIHPTPHRSQNKLIHI